MSDLVLPQLRDFPERHVPRETLLDRAAAAAVAAARRWRRGGGPTPILAQAEARIASMERLDEAAFDKEIRAARAALRATANRSDASLANALAVASEAARRALALQAFPSQILGAAAALRGMAVEMATGEGKTLTAALAASVSGLAGTPAHLVTVNGYLAERDAREMGPLYRRLGLSCGLVTEKTERRDRAAAYRCDITLCTSKELAFDYMRDRLALGRRQGAFGHKVARLSGASGTSLLRGLHFAIVDEADSVLIDEARTPLILSAEIPEDRDQAVFDRALSLAAAMREGRDYLLLARERRIALLPHAQRGLATAAALGPPWNEIAERERLIELALTALRVVRRDENYLVRDGKAEIVDEFTGRILPDRTWSEGLQEMVERKEGLALSPRRSTTARMTYQRFFRRYRCLAGMSGTLREVAGELWRTYRLPVAAIAPHRPDRKRWHAIRGYVSGTEKWEAIARQIRSIHARRAPVLIGTRTVAGAERASAVLRAHGLPHVVLSAAQDAAEASIIAQAGARGAITVATNMAGRGTDIRLAEGVAALGGLHVLITEPHESRRIDRQLAGRCGRQGDPGVVCSYVALDDALLDWHGLSSARRVAAHCGGPVIARIARIAQWRAERLHARMRRDLLHSDEFLGDAIAFAGKPE
ncbi:MAG: prepilin peptidase [Alphaproteobacteria bacterium]|nr:prepilin peptidase [Alphaproteobacteria bacterium]